MHYNFIMLGDLDVFHCERKDLLQEFFSDGWVEVDYFETDEGVLVLVLIAGEPFYD